MSTHDGYERQDWVDFRNEVLDRGDAGDFNSLAKYLKDWQIADQVPTKVIAGLIAESLQIIVDRVTPEGSMQ